MKRLSDFEKLIRECKPTHFVFFSEEQEQEDPLIPCSIRLDFNEIVVDVGSQMVFVKNDSGFLRIERIVGVEVEENCSLIGRMVTFRCGGKAWNTKEYKYKVLIA